MKRFLNNVVHKTQTAFLHDYSRKEVTEYHFLGAMVETSKNYGSSGIVEDVDVIVLFMDVDFIQSRYFFSFRDIRDFAVFHTQLMLCHNLDDLYILINKYDFL